MSKLTQGTRSHEELFSVFFCCGIHTNNFGHKKIPVINVEMPLQLIASWTLSTDLNYAPLTKSTKIFFLAHLYGPGLAFQKYFDWVETDFMLINLLRIHVFRIIPFDFWNLSTTLPTRENLLTFTIRKKSIGGGGICFCL